MPQNQALHYQMDSEVHCVCALFRVHKQHLTATIHLYKYKQNVLNNAWGWYCDLQVGCQQLLKWVNLQFTWSMNGFMVSSKLKRYMYLLTTNATTVSFLLTTYMWQSRVEIEGYSVVYFDRIAAFEAPYRWTSVKGGAHMHFVDAWISNESMKRVWAPLLTEVQRYSASKAVMRSKYVME